MKKAVSLVLVSVLSSVIAWADGLPARSRVAAPQIPLITGLPPVDVNFGGGYVGVVGSHEFDASSQTLGGTAGYTWHTPSGLVWGLEADFGKSWFKQEFEIEKPDEGIEIEDLKIEWFGTARLRAGAAFGPAYAYGTVGVAVQVLNPSLGDHEVATPLVWGAGLELRTVSKVSVKVEWLRVEEESIFTDVDGIPQDIVRLGINYGF